MTSKVKFYIVAGTFGVFRAKQTGRSSLTLSSHLQELKKKHQNLSDAVEAAQRSPSVDDLEISRLKKQKLHLKEEIGRLSAS